MTDDLIAFAKVQLEIAQRIMREKGDFAPMLVFESEKGFGLAAVPFYAEDKSSTRMAMREMLKELGATRYAAHRGPYEPCARNQPPECGHNPSLSPDQSRASSQSLDRT